MEQFTVKNLEELREFAVRFLGELSAKKNRVDSGATVVSLVGDLGVGKTTFVQTLARELGVDEVVNSPTYTIIKSYDLPDSGGFKRLVHMDAYRLDSVEELKPLRFDEYLADPDTLMCIEWADKIKEKLPSDVVHVSIDITEDETREIKVG